jgi:hypothetical protein
MCGHHSFQLYTKVAEQVGVVRLRRERERKRERKREREREKEKEREKERERERKRKRERKRSNNIIKSTTHSNEREGYPQTVVTCAIEKHTHKQTNIQKKKTKKTHTHTSIRRSSFLDARGELVDKLLDAVVSLSSWGSLEK